jgi:hypothetical protein
MAWVKLEAKLHVSKSDKLTGKRRLSSLEILNLDRYGDSNFCRVFLDPCYPKFQFDRCVAGGWVHP